MPIAGPRTAPPPPPDRREQKDDMATANGHDLAQCIQDCLDCYRECLGTATTYCLDQGGDHDEPQHIRLMLDCAEMCRTCADFMIRESASHQAACGLCADLCERCADSCDAIDDEHLRRCAERCRRCAASCREMAAATA
jgi:hypothetical protein